MTVNDAIAKAERILPGTPSPEGKSDPRWQAIIAVGEFIESNPAEVWAFIRRWGVSPSADIRAAIATCLLEHLLEYHFATYFPLTRKLAKLKVRFADTFSCCWKFGQAEEPSNARRFDLLKKQCMKARRKQLR